MPTFLRLLLVLSVIAGLCTGMSHAHPHDAEDNCASRCDPGQHEDTSPADNDDHDSAPHHHDCCHFPSADRTNGVEFVSFTIQGVLVGICLDATMAPDSPVFPLDKPPLI